MIVLELLLTLIALVCMAVLAAPLIGLGAIAVDCWTRARASRKTDRD